MRSPRLSPTPCSDGHYPGRATGWYLARFFEGLFVVVAVGMLIYLVRSCRREGRMPAHLVNGLCDAPGFTGTRYGACPGSPGYRIPVRGDLPEEAGR